MLVKDLIAVDVPFNTKAKNLLEISTKDFFIQLKTIQNSQNYKQDYLDEVMHILNKMEQGGFIKFSSINSPSGTPLLDDVEDSLVIPSTKQSLLRRGKDLTVIDSALATPSTEIVAFSKVPFDTYLALKFISKQQNAIQRGLEFTLTLNDMKRLLKTKRCHYSGVLLELEGELRATLDRKDSAKGYTPDNTVICAKVVNDIKNDLLDTGVNLDKIGSKGLKGMLLKFINII